MPFVCVFVLFVCFMDVIFTFVSRVYLPSVAATLSKHYASLMCRHHGVYIDVNATFYKYHDVASTLMRSCINTMTLHVHVIVFMQLRINVEATSWCLYSNVIIFMQLRINVEATSWYLYMCPLGSFLNFKMKCVMQWCSNAVRIPLGDVRSLNSLDTVI